MAAGFAAAKDNVHRNGFDDGAAVHPPLPGQRCRAQPQPAVRHRHQPLVTFIGLQRITTGRGIAEHSIKAFTCDAGIGRSAFHFVVQFIGEERAGSGATDDMLGQHIERARSKTVRVQLAGLHGIARSQRLQIFKAVARHDQAAAGFIHAVIGAPRALQQARGPLGCTHLDDQINVAPIQPEIEAGGRHDGAQLAGRHRRLHLAAGFGRQAAVVDADRQRLVIFRPQIAEHQFGHRAGVDEHDGQPCAFDAAHDSARRPAAIVATPGDSIINDENVDGGIGTALRHHDLHLRGVGIGRQPAGPAFRIGDGGRKADTLQAWRESLQAGETQHQLVAALGGAKGVNFIDDDALHPDHHRSGFRVGEEIGEAFRRRQQDVRGHLLLPRLARCRRVASAGLQSDIQAHLGNRRDKVALNIHRQRLRGRDVERVQALGGIGGQISQCRQKPRQGLARPCRRSEQRVAALCCGIQHRQLMRTHLPAARSKPAVDDVRQFHSCDPWQG